MDAIVIGGGIGGLTLALALHGCGAVRIVMQNRTAPVEQRTGSQRFERLDDVITKDEMKAIFERYQKVAGYHVQQVSRN
jgi:2-polyprenyl-6-methoxyphenol hydroxylase-like FAD-dependent oxidoreductase